MAYNYCYSTCLGRLVDHMKNGPAKPGTPYGFGCTQLKISPQRLAKLEDHLTFSPGGIAFLKESVRKGILPKMLQEILDTRVMVKNSMKLHNKLAQQNPGKSINLYINLTKPLGRFFPSYYTTTPVAL
jgi:DNA polymerase zeta